MKGNRIRKNNKGDSLILVIGCIALLSIVGIVLLAKSIDNRSMKAAEEQAQASFLGAESSSSELVTVIEAVAQQVVGESFGDMLIEYSLSASKDYRDDRYSQFFSERVKAKLTADTLEAQLKTALGVTDDIAGLSVKYDTVSIEENTDEDKANYTDVVRIKNVEITYSVAGSQSKITTDICIQARIPDVESGFNNGLSRDFQDFGLIADGDVTVSTQQNVSMIGNVYVGGDLVTTGNNVGTGISKAVKLLVKGEMKVESGARVRVEAQGLTFQDGQGVWEGGITVNGGHLNVNGVNVYVVDDLSVEGKDASVVMEGSNAKYVGFSGGKSTLQNHKRSSAITINDVENLTLDLSKLGGLYINGCSYIYEGSGNWGDSTAAGILQGESVAYKDMQAMYLFPGACLPQGHNPIIGSNNEAVNIKKEQVKLFYSFEGKDGTETINLADYVDPVTPFVTRTARLDGGATEATYVYLNFQNEEKATQYVECYLGTSKGDAVKSQKNNLGMTSKILLPEDTYTLANALSYANGKVDMLPAVGSGQSSMLKTVCLLAKQRYGGLFSSLRAEIGIDVSDSFKMVKDGILLTSAFDSLPSNTGTEVKMDNTDYLLYVHNGDFTIDGNTDMKYRQMTGILIVNGDLNIKASSTIITGLVLVTGKVNMEESTVIQSDAKVVETLLTNSQVSKYFRSYGEKKGYGYLSSEAVDISFENWEKN